MIINNVELEDLELFDADVTEKYEKALDTFLKKIESLKGLKTSVSIRKQCEGIFEFFNTLFGPGTDKKVFGEKCNLIVCIKAFEELMNYCNEQTKEIDEITNKYSLNRVQRRTNEYSNRQYTNKRKNRK